MLLQAGITHRDNRRNFLLLFLQSFFFFLTINILDKDTVLPGLLSKMGASEVLIGLLAVITIGLPKFSQFFFGRILQAKYTRKKYLIQGFFVRISALLVIAYILWLYYRYKISSSQAIFLVLLFYTVYSLAAAYTSVGLVDIVPRSIYRSLLKRFYALKQVGHSIVIFIALFLIRPLLRSFPFPFNYSVLHFVAALSLVISTLMIFGVREQVFISRLEFNLKKYFLFVVRELKRNKALFYFALIVNSEGLFLSIIPFFTTLAISKFTLSSRLIVTLFSWKIIGFLVSSSFLFWVKEFEYLHILWLNILISIAVPLLILLFSGQMWIYDLAFFLVGVFHSIYRISYEGILIEISTHRNRAMYASVLGSSNISTFVIPLVSGGLIQSFGYTLTFVLSAILLGFSVFFMLKLKKFLR